MMKQTRTNNVPYKKIESYWKEQKQYTVVEAWLQALECSVRYLNTSNHNGSGNGRANTNNGRNPSRRNGGSRHWERAGTSSSSFSPSSSTKEEDVILYLGQLQLYLEYHLSLEEAKNHVPLHYPLIPYWNTDTDHDEHFDATSYNHDDQTLWWFSGDDNEQDEVLVSSENVSIGTGDEAEDDVVYVSSEQTRKQERENEMHVLRLMIRLLANLSEVHAIRARTCEKHRPVPMWLEGASAYESSFECVKKAQIILDEEYARLVSLEEGYDTTDDQVPNVFGGFEGGGGGGGGGHTVDGAETVGSATYDNMWDKSMAQGKNLKLQQNLSADGEIIMVSKITFANNRDAFLTLGQNRIIALQRKLDPQWSRRDEVKARIGTEKWVNNPNPKNDFAKLRLHDEKELREVKKAVENVNHLEVVSISTMVMDENGNVIDSVEEKNGYEDNGQNLTVDPLVLGTVPSLL